MAGGAAGRRRGGKADPRAAARRATPASRRQSHEGGNGAAPASRDGSARHEQAPRPHRSRGEVPPRTAVVGGGAAPVGASSAGERVLRFLAAIVFLCGVVSFAGSSMFDIHSISVGGNHAVAASDIVSRAGVRTGTSVFTVNAYPIRERLRQDPRIAAVSVGVVFPDRVYITVSERAAAAALRVPQGYVLLGADGVAIAPSGTPGALPTLTVDRLDPAAVQAGTVIPSPDARLGAGLAASLPNDLSPDVAALRVDQAGEVILYTRDGIAVRAGAPDGIRDRLARAADVLAAVRSRGMRVEYVDLRFPGSVIVKPIGATL